MDRRALPREGARGALWVDAGSRSTTWRGCATASTDGSLSGTAAARPGRETRLAARPGPGARRSRRRGGGRRDRAAENARGAADVPPRELPSRRDRQRADRLGREDDPLLGGLGGEARTDLFDAGGFARVDGPSLAERRPALDLGDGQARDPGSPRLGPRRDRRGLPRRRRAAGARRGGSARGAPVLLAGRGLRPGRGPPGRRAQRPARIPHRYGARSGRRGHARLRPEVSAGRQADRLPRRKGTRRPGPGGRAGPGDRGPRRQVEDPDLGLGDHLFDRLESGGEGNLVLRPQEDQPHRRRRAPRGLVVRQGEARRPEPATDHRPGHRAGRARSRPQRRLAGDDDVPCARRFPRGRSDLARLFRERDAVRRRAGPALRRRRRGGRRDGRHLPPQDRRLDRPRSDSRTAGSGDRRCRRTGSWSRRSSTARSTSFPSAPASRRRSATRISSTRARCGFPTGRGCS